MVITWADQQPYLQHTEVAYQSWLADKKPPSYQKTGWLWIVEMRLKIKQPNYPQAEASYQGRYLWPLAFAFQWRFVQPAGS